MKGLYDKIIITIVPGYTGKNITHLLPLQTRKKQYKRQQTHDIYGIYPKFQMTAVNDKISPCEVHQPP